MDARLLITRPGPAGERFLAALEAAAGGPVAAVLSPVLAIRPVAVDPGPRPAGLVLTSENGARRAGELGLGGLPAWCVGARTAAAAREAGLAAVEAGPDADGLVAAILARRPEGPLLHLRGEHARGAVAARLRAGGIEAREAVAYRQAAQVPSAEARALLDGDAPVVAPLFSPRSAALLAAWAPRAPLRVVAMSPAVAEAARAAGLDGGAALAGRPDEAAMVAATLATLRGAGDAAPRRGAP